MTRGICIGGSMVEQNWLLGSTTVQLPRATPTYSYHNLHCQHYIPSMPPACYSPYQTSQPDTGTSPSKGPLYIIEEKHISSLPPCPQVYLSFAGNLRPLKAEGEVVTIHLLSKQPPWSALWSEFSILPLSYYQWGCSARKTSHRSWHSRWQPPRQSSVVFAFMVMVNLP
jgi:hypothetical protein